MPQAASRQLRRADQQQALSRFANLPSEACEAVLTAGGHGAAARALGLLELGRAVMQGQALDSRSDILALHVARPDLASEFVRLCALLDSPDDPAPASLLPMTASPAAAAARAADRIKAGAEFAELVDRIRGLDGFGSFLLPPAPEDLTRHAARGPVIVFTLAALAVTPSSSPRRASARSRCPAWSPRSFWTRPGPGTKRCLSIRPDRRNRPSGRRGSQPQRDPGMAVGRRGRTSAPPPRLPRTASGGSATSARLVGNRRTPRHAPIARGRPPSRGAGDTVLDRVISSYTPTVRALAYARERVRSTPPSRTLIVAMPSTPGLTPLSNVRGEATKLAGMLPSPTMLLEEAGAPTEHMPTRDAVISRLADAGIAHFSCHAASHPDDPSRSQIYLHDHRENPFTVATLVPVHLRHAQLAFLSACQTAHSDAERLIDEGIHLAAAFQLAGFPHVIGTLWPVYDRDCGGHRRNLLREASSRARGARRQRVRPSAARGHLPAAQHGDPFGLPVFVGRVRARRRLTTTGTK